MYADTPLRRPTFDITKAIKPIGAFFVRIFDAFIEARRLQTAFNIATHLKATNRDFQSISHGDLVRQILDEENPTHIDGTPVKR